MSSEVEAQRLLAQAKRAAEADRADLTLTDGRVLKGARIVAVGEKTVSVSQSGSLFNIPLADVPAATLVRARIEIEERSAARRKAYEASAPEAARQAADAQAKRDEEIRLRLAAANMRAAAQGDAQVAMPVKSGRNIAAELLAIKAKFPAKRASQFRHGYNRVVEFDVPHVDAWTHYRGMVQTTTPEALPRTLQMIDERTKQDVAMFAKRVGDRANPPRTSDEAQARASLEWLERDLKGYLAQLRALVR